MNLHFFVFLSNIKNTIFLIVFLILSKNLKIVFVNPKNIMVITNIITPIMAHNMLMSCTTHFNNSDTSDKQEPISHDVSLEVKYSSMNNPNNIINLPLTERYINMYRENRISINNISTPVKTFRTKKINNNNRRNHIIHQPSGANCSQRR